MAAGPLPLPVRWERLYHTSPEAELRASYDALHRVANLGVSNPHHYFFRQPDFVKLRARLLGTNSRPSLCIFRWKENDKRVFVHFCRRGKLAAPLLDQSQTHRGIVVNAGFTPDFDNDVPQLRVLIEQIVAHVVTYQTDYFGADVTYPLEILVSPSFHMPDILNQLLSTTGAYQVMPLDVIVVKEDQTPSAKRAWREVIYHRYAIKKVV